MLIFEMLVGSPPFQPSDCSDHWCIPVPSHCRGPSLQVERIGSWADTVYCTRPPPTCALNEVQTFSGMWIGRLGLTETAYRADNLQVQTQARCTVSGSAQRGRGCAGRETFRQALAGRFDIPDHVSPVAADLISGLLQVRRLLQSRARAVRGMQHMPCSIVCRQVLPSPCLLHRLTLHGSSQSQDVTARHPSHAELCTCCATHCIN